MIARIWTARATAARAPEYDAYFQETVMPELQGIPGFEGATLLNGVTGDRVEITVITWWTSIDAVRAFAGEAVETAVVHDDAARVLIDFDRTVTHRGVIYDQRRRQNTNPLP